MVESDFKKFTFKILYFEYNNDELNSFIFINVLKKDMYCLHDLILILCCFCESPG